MIYLALVSKSRIDSARLYYIILVILPIACVLAIEFEALRLPDGSSICGAGPSIIDGVFRTVSVIGCAIQCGLRNNASSVQCNFFNYFKQSKRCELFFDSPVLNFTLNFDCVSYKVKTYSSCEPYIRLLNHKWHTAQSTNYTLIMKYDPPAQHAGSYIHDRFGYEYDMKRDQQVAQSS